MNETITRVLMGLPIATILILLILFLWKMPVIVFFAFCIFLSYLIGFVFENLGV